MKNINLILALVLAMPCIMVQASQLDNTQQLSVIRRDLTPSNENTSKIEDLPSDAQRKILSYLFAGPEKYTQENIRNYCIANELRGQPKSRTLLDILRFEDISQNEYESCMQLTALGENLHEMKPLLSVPSQPRGTYLSFREISPLRVAEWFFEEKKFKSPDHQIKIQKIYTIFCLQSHSKLATHPVLNYDTIKRNFDNFTAQLRAETIALGKTLEFFDKIYIDESYESVDRDQDFY